MSTSPSRAGPGGMVVGLAELAQVTFHLSSCPLGLEAAIDETRFTLHWSLRGEQWVQAVGESMLLSWPSTPTKYSSPARSAPLTLPAGSSDGQQLGLLWVSMPR